MDDSVEVQQEGVETVGEHSSKSGPEDRGERERRGRDLSPLNVSGYLLIP
jgi:hypothetical protein